LKAVTIDGLDVGVAKKRQARTIRLLFQDQERPEQLKGDLTDRLSAWSRLVQLG
jgi:hypothetical protein